MCSKFSVLGVLCLPPVYFAQHSKKAQKSLEPKFTKKMIKSPDKKEPVRKTKLSKIYIKIPNENC